MKKILFLLFALCSLASMVYGDIVWSTPVSISTASTNASEPHVVIDTNGNVTAVWLENNVVKASSQPSGGSWTSPVALSNTSNTASSPKLGIDGSGNVTALWIENNVVESATLPLGGSWTAESSSISSSGASSPVWAVYASGNALAVWALVNAIQSSTRISGTWSLVSTLASSNSSNPSISISSSGIAMAAWHTTISGNDSIATNTLTISGNTWGTVKYVFTATPSYSHNYPKVVLDSSGNATVAWFRYNVLNGNAYQNVQVASSSLNVGGSTWGIPTLISNSGILNPADLMLKLMVDSNGDALAVWTNSYDGETYSVEASRKLFGLSWPGSVLTQVPSLYSLAIDVAVTQDTALLVNMAFDGVSNLLIQSSESDITDPIVQGWTSSNVFSTGSENGYPKCAIALNGSNFNAAAVWINNNGTYNTINAATGSSSVIAPPTSVTATQSSTNYGVYTDYYNTVSWTASTDPTVIQYNVFRNGVYFTAVDAGTTQIVDHNAVSSGAVTYGVAALTSEFRQSQIVSYTLP